MWICLNFQMDQYGSNSEGCFLLLQIWYCAFLALIGEPGKWLGLLWIRVRVGSIETNKQNELNRLIYLV